jgi:Protein of unknown function (DUF1592)/Protein of unknown function (DUF1588)/Protein of unknown function (DUF1595)/Protein of unknown function (DUF1585)/Protein of unknown function (DUF1587)
VGLSSRAALAVVSVLGAVAVSGGCDGGDPAHPSHLAGRVAPSLAVGPTPLRRLSDREYLNALHDLFPALILALPQLPDDVPVAGFENAAEAQQPSDVLIARYEAIAGLYAAAATADAGAVSALVGCPDWSTSLGAALCAVQFVMQTGRRIFRRPLSVAERTRYLLQFQTWESAVDFEGAVQLTLSAMLQSPQFLYRAEVLPQGAQPGTVIAVDPYAMASRLSFFLWESGPDEALLEAASRDELGTQAQIRAQATRMLADDRAKRVLWDFPRQWLGLDRILTGENLVRTPQVDPAWTATTQASASTETQLFVKNTLGGGTLPELLTSRRAWIDSEMARVYGISPPATPWSEVSLPESQRAGLLTRVAYLAGYSHAGATSPPVRGNAIQLRLLCQLPVSPPPGADLSQPMAAPGQGPQTNRMLFETRTSPPACQVCHVSLNGFGFGLEGYNAAGHYQTRDDGLPVDASGAIHGTDVDGPFNGGIALSEALSKSEVVHHCATEELVRYALGRAPVDAELPTVDALANAFMEGGGDVRALLVAVATSPTFRTRLVEEN